MRQLINSFLIYFIVLLAAGLSTSCTSKKPQGNITQNNYEKALDQMSQAKSAEKKLVLLAQAQEKVHQSNDMKSCAGMLVGDCEKRNLLEAVISELPSAMEFQKDQCESYRSHLRQQFNPSGEDDPEELTMGFVILDQLCESDSQ